MTTLRKSLAAYLELRRGMGFKLRYYERRLGRFLSFVEERGTKKITTQLAIQSVFKVLLVRPKRMLVALAIFSLGSFRISTGSASASAPKCRNRKPPK